MPPLTDKEPKPFPWPCFKCQQEAVLPQTIPFKAEVKHDGRTYTVEIPDLELPTCRNCGEQVISNNVTDRVLLALRRQLRLLTPEEIQQGRRALGLKAKELAERLGVAKETLSRWEKGRLIQSRAMDNLLRLYFDLPEVRMAVENLRKLTDGPASILAQWAALGAELASRRRQSRLTWQPVTAMIEVVREKLKGEADRFITLLRQSRDRLHPLEDPFDLDLGVHRWLAADREEAYSDWLQWILQQLPDSTAIFRILRIEPPPDTTGWDKLSPEIEREYPIPFGHEEQTGRLDLLIRYPDEFLVAVEVKVTGAEEADTGKHAGYLRWLKGEKSGYKYGYAAVLLAVAPEEEGDDEFQFVSWAQVCIELRRIAPTVYRNKRITVAAMILAFVAAVEQNLLGFSASLVRNISQHRPVLFSSAIVEHLADSLK